MLQTYIKLGKWKDKLEYTWCCSKKGSVNFIGGLYRVIGWVSGKT